MPPCHIMGSEYIDIDILHSLSAQMATVVFEQHQCFTAASNAKDSAKACWALNLVWGLPDTIQVCMSYTKEWLIPVTSSFSHDNPPN